VGSALRVAVLGLGEAGRELALALKVAGADVVAYEAGRVKNPPVELAESAEAAVDGADVILSVNSSTVAARTAESVAAALRPGAIYADLNPGTPALKQRLAGIIPDGLFADVAVPLTTVDDERKEPMMVSGHGANKLIEKLSPYGLCFDYVSDEPGAAAARNLIRSMLAKGMAAVVADTLWAAKAMGLDQWAINEINKTFDAASSAAAQAALNDTAKHAKVRSVEMTDIVEMLAAANYDSTLVNGVGLTFSHVMHGRKVPFADLSED